MKRTDTIDTRLKCEVCGLIARPSTRTRAGDLIWTAPDGRRACPDCMEAITGRRPGTLGQELKRIERRRKAARQ